VTYEQIEVKVDVPGPSKPGKIFVYSGQEPVVAVLPKLDKRLWDIRAGLARDEFTPEEKRQLSEGLGERMRPLLQLIQGAPPDSRYRLRLTLTSTGVDDLPWRWRYSSRITACLWDWTRVMQWCATTLS